MEQLIYIEQNDKEKAAELTRGFALEKTKERVFINALGAELAMKYLAQENVSISNVYNMHNIHGIRGEFDIADVMLSNIHIDVRVVYDENLIFVPKSHFEYDITPDLYLVFKMSQDLSFVEFLGFFEPRMLNKNNQNDDYYFFEKEKLSHPSDLINFIGNFDGNTTKNFSEEEIENGQKLALSLIDNNISEEDKKSLLSILSKSSVLREDLIDFENFEIVSYHTARTEDLNTISPEIELIPDEFDIFDSIDDFDNTDDDLGLNNIFEIPDTTENEETEVDIESDSVEFSDDETDKIDDEITEEENAETFDFDGETEELTTDEPLDIVGESEELTTDEPLDIVGESEELTTDEPMDIVGESEELTTDEPMDIVGETEELSIDEPMDIVGETEELTTDEPMDVIGETEELTTDEPMDVIGETEELSIDEPMDIIGETEELSIDEPMDIIGETEELTADEPMDIVGETEELSTDEPMDVIGESEELTTDEPMDVIGETEELTTDEPLDIVGESEELTTDEPEELINEAADLPSDENIEIPEEEQLGTESETEVSEPQEISDEITEEEIEHIEQNNVIGGIGAGLAGGAILSEALNDINLADGLENLAENINLPGRDVNDLSDDNLTEIENLDITEDVSSTEDNTQDSYEENTLTSFDTIEPVTETEPVFVENQEDTVSEEINELENLDDLEKPEEISDEIESVEENQTQTELIDNLFSMNNFEDDVEEEVDNDTEIPEETVDFNNLENTEESTEEEPASETTTEEDVSGFEDLANPDEAQEETPAKENETQENETESFEETSSTETTDDSDTIKIEDLDNVLSSLESENSETSTESFESETVISSTNPVTGEIPLDINKSEEEKLEVLYNENTEKTEDMGQGLNLENPSQEKGKKAVILASAMVALIAAGSVGAYMMLNKQNPTPTTTTPNINNENITQMPKPQDQPIPSTTNVNKKEDNNVQTVTQSDTPAKVQQPAGETPYVDVKKLGWAVPSYLSYNENFKKYLQTAGKSLKLSLSSDLLMATEYNYSDIIQVDITLTKEGTLKDAKVMQTSGSAQIDGIVLQTVKDTLNVVKAPAGVIDGDSAHLTLKIYL